MSSEFVSRFRLAVSSEELSGKISVLLTPVPTKFGLTTDAFHWGFSLSVKVVSLAETGNEAVGAWADALSVLVPGSEKL